MRNSEDIGEPDYQAINSRLIGKPVLSSYLNAREYTPKYEDDEVGQREEGYSGGTDYQALNSQLIGKPVLSSYLSGGRYIPKNRADRDRYIEELLGNQEYFKTLAEKAERIKDPENPSGEKMDLVTSAAFAGFYPAKIPENKDEEEDRKEEWEKRKRKYLKYLDIPTRAVFFGPTKKKEDVWNAKEIPEVLERLMRYPYFRSAASLLGGFLTRNGYVTFPKDDEGYTIIVVEKEFNNDALMDFLLTDYYPNVANWSRQVKRELKETMKPGDDREEKLEEAKAKLREKVNSEAVKEEALAAAEKKEKKIADEINSIIAKLEEKSNEYEGKTVWDLSQHFFKADERNSIPGTWSNSDKPLREFRNEVKGLKTPRGKAYTAIEKAMVNLLRYNLVNEILQDVDIKTAKKFWHVVIGKGEPETFIKRLRPPLRGTREPVKYTAADVEEKLKLKEKIKEASKAAEERENEKQQARMNKIRVTKAPRHMLRKNIKAAMKKGTTVEEKPATAETTDGEKPASEKATTQKTKKGRAASGSTGTKSRSRVGSAALSAKTTTTKSTTPKAKTPRKKVAKTPSASTPALPAKGTRTTPTKKGTRTRNKKTVPASAIPLTTETSSKEKAQGMKRAGTTLTRTPKTKRSRKRAPDASTKGTSTEEEIVPISQGTSLTMRRRVPLTQSTAAEEELVPITKGSSLTMRRRKK